MAASCAFDEFNGAGSTRTASVSNLNMGSNDSANLVTATYPITAGSNSYEKFIKANFTGTFNYIGSLFVWHSGTSCVYATGEVLKITGSSTSAPAYATPVATTSTIATNTCGSQSVPTVCNVHINGNIAGSLTAAGSSDFVVWQLQTTVSTPPGNLTQKTLKLQWTEA